jgi:hypothetical protein
MSVAQYVYNIKCVQYLKMLSLAVENLWILEHHFVEMTVFLDVVIYSSKHLPTFQSDLPPSSSG